MPGASVCLPFFSPCFSLWFLFILLLVVVLILIFFSCSCWVFFFNLNVFHLLLLFPSGFSLQAKVCLSTCWWGSDLHRCILELCPLALCFLCRCWGSVGLHRCILELWPPCPVCPAGAGALLTCTGVFWSSDPLPCFSPADAAGAQVCGSAEARAGLAGAAALQAHAARHRVPAVLLPPHDGQEGAQEAEDWGSLRGALQEAPHRLGEQDHAAAAKNWWAGNSSSASKSCLASSALWAFTEFSL